MATIAFVVSARLLEGKVRITELSVLMSGPVIISNSG
jgi:hypothetical protein